MAQKFLERNKKKGLLAALLLFFRKRKAVSLLLLVVMLASTIVGTPSYILVDLPGGSRLVAGVAWVAQKVGVDTSSWGLRERRSFRDLIAVFRAARTAGASRSVGWGPFFGPAPGGAVPNSLDMVKGSRKDLESIGAGGGAAGKAGTIKGVMTPAESKASRDGDGVAISEEDLKGQRQGMLGGMMSGLFGSKESNAEMISGGAYAGKGFFGGSAGGAGGVGAGGVGGAGAAGSAAVSPNARAQAGMNSVGNVAVPGTHTAGGASGRISQLHVKAVNARAIAGGNAARSLGNHLALTQLAEGSGRADQATDACVEPACPHEYASAQIGAIYDGNALADRDLLSGPDDTTPSVPIDDLSGAAGDAVKVAECSTKVQKCQQAKSPYMARLGELQTQLNSLYTQMGGACGDPCSCGGCNSLKSQIGSICGGELQTVLAEIDKTCDLPSYCATLGITDPSTASAGASRDLCKMNMMSCGCTNWFCDICCVIHC